VQWMGQNHHVGPTRRGGLIARVIQSKVEDVKIDDKVDVIISEWMVRPR
jgi:hypothetical protein